MTNIINITLKIFIVPKVFPLELITTVMAKVRRHDLQGTNAALGSVTHMKVTPQFPLKHVDSRYSRKINLISVQIFVLGEKLVLWTRIIKTRVNRDVY